MKLNMGCGMDIKDGYLNVDSINLPGVEKVYDFEIFPYPFEDSTFDEIYCSHILEHMSDLGKVMEEFTRIGKNGCQIKIKVPFFASPNAYGDYTHKRSFNTNTFKYFTPEHYYNNAKIITKKYKIHFLSNSYFLKSNPINIIPDFLINLFPQIYERFFCYLIPAVEIHYLLEVKK
ncbi:class I SAM-dependent methyltransferase [Candidatus Gracilibacteria bacterium]|nr:class I SAM-dependent methyltransferase [Candidatus Gracilibacteria bacterium]